MDQGRVAGEALRVRGRAARDRESGQALLELALVVPILILLLMAIFQFAYVFQTQMGLTNAGREAARRMAATDPGPITSASYWTSAEQWVQGQLCGASATCDGGLLAENVQGFDGARLTDNPPEITFCWYWLTNATGTIKQYRVHVDLLYEHPIFFGPMAFATDLVDGTPNNGNWDISAAAEMRLENIDDSGSFQLPPDGQCP